MRKILILLISFSLFLNGAYATFSYKYKGNTLVYRYYSSTEAAVVLQDSAVWANLSGVVKIPSEVRDEDGDRYKVVRIDDKAFGGEVRCRDVGDPVPSDTSASDKTVAICCEPFSHCDKVVRFVFPNTITSIGDKVFSGCRSLRSVVIPKSVFSLGEELFSGCSGLEEVVLPETITKIGDDMFSGCEALAFVKIPNSVTSIGKGAFLGCALQNVVIPNSVTSIGEGALRECESLQNIEVAHDNKYYSSKGGALFNKAGNTLLAVPGGFTAYTVPNTVKHIGEYAFRGCSNLHSVEIPNSVTSIGNSAFYYCTNLQNVVIPNSVTSISYSAFRGCSNLQSVEIPNSVTTIGEYAFSSCANLQSVEIPNSVASVERGVFCGCKSLQSVVIPNSVTSIGDEAFRACSNLQSVDIPNSVTSIGEWAFSYCSNLQSVVVPSSITNIEPKVFYSCLRLSKIEVSSDNKHYSSKDGVLFNKSGDTLLAVPGAFTAYTVPNSVKHISRDAFYGCKNLQSVVIPNSVTRIGGFGYLENLQNVVIPNSVELIEGFTFVGCKKLQSIVIPNSVMLISGCAFLECENLKSITVEAQTPPIVREDVFTETSLQTIYVPAASVEKYKAAEGWKKYADKIQPIK